MFHGNVDKVMKALCICSDGPSCWCMFAASVRMKKLGSLGIHLLWLQTLLVILLAGQAFCDQTSAAPTPPFTLPTTTAQSSVQYVIGITVNVTGQKIEESEIKAWLINVFQNNLESCGSPNFQTTATPIYTQTTAANISNVTTLMTTKPSTLESNNTTVAITATTLESNNTTVASTTTAIQSSNTTIATIATTLESNSTTIGTTATTSENNNTTIATTATTLENNSTTIATTATLENNNTTIATTATTLENNNTTKATTATTLENNKTTIATTATTLENNKTTIATTATTLENNSTTIATTATTLENNRTTMTTTATSENNNTTLATTPTTLENNTTTIATTATTLLNNTTTLATTPTTLENNNTTLAITTTTLESNNTTTATTALDNSKTTVATTTRTSQSSNTKTTSTLENINTTTATKATTSKGPSGTPATPKTTTFKSNNPSVDTTGQLTTAAPTQNYSPTTFSTIVITQTLNDGASSNPTLKRMVRAIDSVTQSSDISNTTTTGLFQSIDVSCTVNTSILNTECSVRLTLKQTVPACCLLRTLCAASETSSDIHVVGNKAYKDQPQNECNNNTQEETSCTYTGPVTESCEDSGYVPGQINSTNCGPVTGNNNCSCSAYCNSADAYYTFQISVQNFELNISYVSSLISEKLKQAQNCTSANNSCPSSSVAVAYKTASLTCGSIVTNHQNCSVILGFSKAVSTCDVAGAMVNVFQSQNQISYDGLVTRAAICGNSDLSIISPTPKFTSVKLKPDNFCVAIQASNNFTCNNEENLIVQLEDQCVQMPTTTPSPNATTIQPNTTISSVNATVTASVNTSTAVNEANALLELTRDISKLNSSQVDQLVSELQSLLSGPNVSMALGNISVNIVSNLLGASPETLAHSSNNIIGIVDTVGLKLVLDNKTETLLAPAVALSVKPADGSNFQETFFSISNPNNVQVRGNPRVKKSLTTDSSTPQGSIMLPPSLTQGLTPEQQQLATRVQFNFYQKSTVFQDRSLGQRKLNSGILGASVSNLSITGLKNNVVITLRNTEPVPANFVATCVFWDFTLNNRSGGWNPAGCFVQNRTDSETVCGCNHLTSFAILLDLSRGQEISPRQATILTFITYIGCGISAIFLSITLLTYLAFEKLRKDIPSKILIQLCFALLLLNLVFLVDAWLALYPNAVGLCISTAWFLHYFLLVSFTWMGLEAVHMYNALVKVFNNHISRYMLKFSVVGWGIPMIVVIIVIAIDKNNYGLVSYGKFTDGRSDDFCWLKNDIAFYVAVVAYFCIIFLFNLIMFIVVLVQLSRIKQQNPQNVQHRSTLENVRSVAGLTILLGLTWGFAFFAWGPVNLAFTYLFAIFNSLQGFFIFVFYCAVKENVRRQWRTYLCCGKMRLAENSEWSRTATQKTMKKSSSNKLTTLHSSQSNTSSSSSFLVTNSSEQINGISSPFEDRVITAEENGSRDVILNEINSQHRNQQAL